MSWGSGTLASRPQVRERDLPFVTHTLSSEFTILRVVNGETVAAENLSITNGFVKPKMGELGWRGVPPAGKPGSRSPPGVPWIPCGAACKGQRWLPSQPSSWCQGDSL